MTLSFFSESAEGLQKQLTALYSYASLWHIIVSIPKTKILVFNERYTKVPGSFHYGDNIIEKAEQYKYLGVVYSTKFGKAIFSLRKQSHPVVGKLHLELESKHLHLQYMGTRDDFH